MRWNSINKSSIFLGYCISPTQKEESRLMTNLLIREFWAAGITKDLWSFRIVRTSSTACERCWTRKTRNCATRSLLLLSGCPSGCRKYLPRFITSLTLKKRFTDKNQAKLVQHLLGCKESKSNPHISVTKFPGWSDDSTWCGKCAMSYSNSSERRYSIIAEIIFAFWKSWFFFSNFVESYWKSGIGESG